MRSGRQQYMKHTCSIFCLLLLLPLSSFAQWNVTARLDTNSIRIGEQPTLTLSMRYAVKEEERSIDFPVVEDELGPHVETIERSPVDTLIPGEGGSPERKRLIQEIRITSFDSGRHRIPPFQFIVDDDTVNTDPLLLEVKSVPLRKSKEPEPIKGIHEFPYTWSAWFRDHWPWFAAGGGLLLFALFLFLYYRYRQRQKAKEPETPPRPPHEQAMERLEELRSEEAYQEWEAKAYYTELSDILRHYLEERYLIPALEETTPKILNELSFTQIDEEGKGRVRKILRTADMVKFAKQRPEAGKKKEALEEVLAFVERSKPKSESQDAEEDSG